MGLCACGARIADSSITAGPDANTRDDDHDAPVTEGDAPDVDAFVLGDFGAPQPLTFANTNVDEDDGTMSWDGMEIIFARKDATEKHLYVSRKDAQGVWSTPVKTAFAGGSAIRDEGPRYSADNLTLYFGSTRTPNSGGSDIWMITRQAATDAWGATPTKITTLTSNQTDKWVSPCATDFLMIRTTEANGQSEIYGGTGLAAPTKVEELDSATSETGTLLALDCLTAYFASTRGGTNDLWTSHRTSTTTPWQTPTKLSFSTDTKDEQDPWMSTDGRTFLFASNVNGSIDLFMATR